jgi:hypothetical protein
MESASLEDRKEFVRALVGGVSVVPGEARLDVQMRTPPALGALQPANSTCRMAAGARYEPLQIVLRPMERFLAGMRRAAQGGLLDALDPLRAVTRSSRPRATSQLGCGGGITYLSAAPRARMQL